MITISSKRVPWDAARRTDGRSTYYTVWTACVLWIPLVRLWIREKE